MRYISLFKDKIKKGQLLKLVLVLAIFFAIPLTVYLVQITQIFKSKASETTAISVSNFLPKVETMLQPGKNITGQGIPTSNVSVAIIPNGPKKEVISDENGTWVYQIPQNLEPKSYRLNVTVFDKANHIASVKNYPIRITPVNSSFLTKATNFALSIVGTIYGQESISPSAGTTINSLSLGSITPTLKQVPPSEVIKLNGPPDSNTPMYRLNHKLYAFVSTPDLNGTSRANSDNLNDLKNAGYESTNITNDFWLESIIPKAPTALWGYYHNEPHDGIHPLTEPKIGVSKSVDNGLTWSDTGIIFQEPEDSYNPDSKNKFFDGGIGDFSAIQSGDKVYIYATSYPKDFSKQGIVALSYPANSPASETLTRNIWNGTSWQAANDDLPTPITPAFRAISDALDIGANFFWGPSIHYSSHLKMYVMLLNHADDESFGADGIFVSYNSNIANPAGWSAPVKIDQARTNIGVEWYPEVVGELDSDTDQNASGITARYFEKGESKYEIAFLKPGELLGGQLEPSMTPSATQTTQLPPTPPIPPTQGIDDSPVTTLPPTSGNDPPFINTRCLLGISTNNIKVGTKATFTLSGIPLAGVSAHWIGKNHVSDLDIDIDKNIVDFKNDGSGNWTITYGPYDDNSVGTYSRAFVIYDQEGNHPLCTSNNIDITVDQPQPQDIQIITAPAQTIAGGTVNLTLVCSDNLLKEDCDDNGQTVKFSIANNPLLSSLRFIKQAFAQGDNETILHSSKLSPNNYALTLPIDAAVGAKIITAELEKDSVLDTASTAITIVSQGQQGGTPPPVKTLPSPSPTPKPSPLGLITGPYPDLVINPGSVLMITLDGATIPAEGATVAPGQWLNFSAMVYNQSTSCIASHTSGNQFYTSFNIYKGLYTAGASPIFNATAPAIPPICQTIHPNSFGEAVPTTEGSQWQVPATGVYSLVACADSNSANYSPGGNVLEYTRPTDESAYSNCTPPLTFTALSGAANNTTTPPANSSGAGDFPFTAIASCNDQQRPQITLNFNSEGNPYIFGWRANIFQQENSAYLIYYGGGENITVKDTIDDPEGYLENSNLAYQHMSGVNDVAIWGDSNTPLLENTPYFYSLFRANGLGAWDYGSATVTTPNCQN